MMSKRYCTMPNIPYFRDWFEKNFGDLCEKHDKAYALNAEKLKPIKADKIKADFDFCKEVALRGYMFMAVMSLLAFQLPWVGR